MHYYNSTPNPYFGMQPNAYQNNNGQPYYGYGQIANPTEVRNQYPGIDLYGSGNQTSYVNPYSAGWGSYNYLGEIENSVRENEELLDELEMIDYGEDDNNWFEESEMVEQNIYRQQQQHQQQHKGPKHGKGGGHTHAHFGATTCQDGHTHLHPGVTSTPIETQQGHVHKISGHTSFDDGHIHSYEEYTGPAIQLPNGYHTHYAEIRTTENDGHVHIIRGFTAPSKS
ncbi:YmaF family [Schinkia azotoformans MEV2011]|uniref:YmaF family n=1 Tax=Schinkia azotoformans MEV2011 TaxID=1348973 RepID=A0A072NGK6_SCHAZ|nr:YmaF family protein [Schinkia azotoformans]KEF36616.1 YmaF family [Schinkia azotoformans MEV2011]MEC1695581.1 YmaF family protein [Schinkia azotoformans]MEC1723976.1 YmaF family protein [Schinkia azotoformans]MEC1740772.1 YmaF family protein [Schinkia azotoformans]MEC1743892.1 YmaF family protein [Schinkia azotoformans]